MIAHPLDVSLSLFTFKQGSSYLEASTYIHPFEVGVLLEKQGIKTQEFDEVYEYKQLFFDYIQSHIAVVNNAQVCEMNSFSLPKKNDFEVLSDGLEVRYDVECSQELDEIIFTNKIFTEDFVLQTNKMMFYELSDISSPVFSKILTSKLLTDRFLVSDPSKVLNPQKDTDGDGLSDTDEAIYGTEIELTDTDFDSFSDLEEIESGWDALDPVASPGQQQVEDVEVAKNNYIEYIQSTSRGKSVQELREDFDAKKSTKVDSSERERLQEQIRQENPASTLSGSVVLKEALEFLTNFLKDASFLGLLKVTIVVFLLGALHALSPGHGKSIFFAYLLEKDRTFTDVIRYSSALTITHLLDVIVIGILIRMFSLWADISAYITLLQQIGAVGLFIVAVYVLVMAYKNFNVSEKEKTKKKTSSAMLGIFAGLAPCTYGWAILMTMLAVGEMQWILPILMGFGIGIFMTVTVLGFVILRFRDLAHNRIASFAKYSAFASGGLLMFFAIQMLLIVM